MKISCNVHTHTTFCDGNNTAEEMVLGAIKCGCTTLGFSGHSYMNVIGAEEWTMTPDGQNKYAQEIQRLKSKYVDKIEILLGIEQDYFSETLEFKCDYVIGSVHTIEKNGEYFSVDITPEKLKSAIDKYYGGDIMSLIKDYYSLLVKVVDKTDCDIVGHFDLITKFNEKRPLFDASSKEYREISLDALDALIPKHRLFEINTGAISRGWRTHAYPDEFILRRLAEKGADVIITSDSHACDTILYGFDDAVEYARFCGVKHLCVYENNNISKISI